MIYEKGKVANGIIPFDKDKLVIAELSNGSITDELPFKDGGNLACNENDFIYFVDKENKFRSYSLIDRSQTLFWFKKMKGWLMGFLEWINHETYGSYIDHILFNILWQLWLSIIFLLY